jgi:hypothetical protein
MFVWKITYEFGYPLGALLPATTTLSDPLSIIVIGVTPPRDGVVVAPLPFFALSIA